MKLARLFLLPLLALALMGMGKKQTVSVRFHVEANPRDGESFAVPAKFHNPDRDGFVERVASVSEREIAAVKPIPADDDTFGCVFKLDTHGTIGLQTLSTERRGAVVVPVVNTKAGPRQLPEMMIDKPITDGIIYIPRGFTQSEINEIQKQFPLIGQTRKRK
jgi:hypothetical protein